MMQINLGLVLYVIRERTKLERRRARFKRYYYGHPDKMRARKTRYYAENREVIRAKSHEYYRRMRIRVDVPGPTTGKAIA
jgi:hypothetical protein